MALPDTITVEDLFGPPERAGASISPDGTRIAYLAPWKNRLNVWVQRLDTDEDPRERHRGLSHHTRAILALAGEVEIAWPLGTPSPDGLDDVALIDVSGWEEACAGLPLSHMGRGSADDPTFFAAAFAAGRLARSVLS